MVQTRRSAKESPKRVTIKKQSSKKKGTIKQQTLLTKIIPCKILLRRVKEIPQKNDNQEKIKRKSNVEKLIHNVDKNIQVNEDLEVQNNNDIKEISLRSKRVHTSEFRFRKLRLRSKLKPNVEILGGVGKKSRNVDEKNELKQPNIMSALKTQTNKTEGKEEQKESAILTLNEKMNKKPSTRSSKMGLNLNKTPTTRSGELIKRSEIEENKTIPISKSYIYEKQPITSEQLKEALSKIASTKKDQLNKLPSEDKIDSDVYDFLSQSVASLKEDVTSDVVQKLVQDGKATFIKYKKMKAPNVKKRKPFTKNWHDVVKNLPVNTNDVKMLQRRNEAKLTSKKIPITSTTNPILETLPTTVGETMRTNQSFSNLAKSVMTHQTIQSVTNNNNSSTLNLFKSSPQRQMLKDKQKLLEIARNIVNQSTPVNKTALKNTTLTSPRSQGSFISPIRNVSSSPMRFIPSASMRNVPPSSWRVLNKDVPTTFYFSRNNDDLPSYSSDFTVSSQNENVQNISASNSNGENISPANKSHRILKKIQIQEDTVTRKALGPRSPLKAINVLQVVNLPDWRQNQRKKNKVQHMLQKPGQDENAISRNAMNITKSANEIGKKNSSLIDTDDLLSFDDILEKLSPAKRRRLNTFDADDDFLDLDNILQQKSPVKTNTSNNLNYAENIFGFDDILKEQSPIKKQPLPTKETLKEKLDGLKSLLPQKPTRISYGTLKSVFKSPAKQSDIRHVLSSTMVNNKTPQNQIAFDESINLTIPEEEQSTENTEDLHLFGDLEEPQTSFDNTVKRRTYGRLRTRKPKVCHDFILFSHDEDSDEEIEKRPRLKKDTRKRKGQQAKQLDKFVQEFNSMCEEVNNYQLLVDSDKSKDKS